MLLVDRLHGCRARYWLVSYPGSLKFILSSAAGFSLAVKIRLARHGAKKRPYYRVVVADGRMPRDGRYIEEVGRYNPLTNPKVIDINLEKVDEWVAKGAQPTNAVSHLIDIARNGQPVVEKKTKISKKAAAKAAAAAEAAAEAADAE